jgi:DNA-binding response OmpR family regulator
MNRDDEPITVCVADADVAHAARLAKLLDGAGYRVVRVHKARLMYAALQNHRVDLIVLGGLLLDGNALVALEGLQNGSYHVPIILLSGLWHDKHSASVLRRHTEVMRVLRPPLADQDLLMHVRTIAGMPTMVTPEVAQDDEEKRASLLERTFAVRALVDLSLADFAREEAA